MIRYLFLLACVQPAFAGGFMIQAQASDHIQSLLTIQTLGCHQPQDANITIHAHRQAGSEVQVIELEIRPSKQSGMFEVLRPKDWQGAWVIVVQASYRGMERSLLARSVPDGTLDMDSIQALGRPITEKDVAAALKKLAPQS